MTNERRAELEAFRDELAQELKGHFATADGYYNTKDRYWQVVAELAGKTELEMNPMGFWYRHSN